jgi:mRNA degradation ribonuclease J1/J2
VKFIPYHVGKLKDAGFWDLACKMSRGHAHPEDLADLARRLHPSAVVPIHTEAAPQFAAFIPNVRVVNDGEAVEIASLIADYDIRTGLLAE